MRYLMIHYYDEREIDFTAEPDRADPVELEVQAWVAEAEATGVKLDGARLRPSSEAVTVRIRAGERLLTDGPFAETKEQVAGFDVLECDSLAEAIEMAARHPTTRSGTIEVRQFWE
jgi:hypothetical protein